MCECVDIVVSNNIYCLNVFPQFAFSHVCRFIYALCIDKFCAVCPSNNVQFALITKCFPHKELKKKSKMKNLWENFSGMQCQWTHESKKKKITQKKMCTQEIKRKLLEVAAVVVVVVVAVAVVINKQKGAKEKRRRNKKREEQILFLNKI